MLVRPSRLLDNLESTLARHAVYILRKHRPEFLNVSLLLDHQVPVNLWPLGSQTFLVFVFVESFFCLCAWSCLLSQVASLPTVTKNIYLTLTD